MKQSHIMATPMRAIPPPGTTAMALHATRHDGLVLLGARAGALVHGPVLHHLAGRLLAPAARIEGLDRHLDDQHLIGAAPGARGFILRLPPLGNLDNPFYSVHCRRNDRFLRAKPRLKALFPAVDFAAFDFTGHMLGTLHATCPERFARLRAALSDCWLEKLLRLLAALPRRGVLLQLPSPPWLAPDRSAPESPDRPVLALGGNDARALAATLGPVLQQLLAAPACAGRSWATISAGEHEKGPPT